MSALIVQDSSRKGGVSVYGYGCVRACVRTCVRVPVHVCVRACVCMCVCINALSIQTDSSGVNTTLLKSEGWASAMNTTSLYERVNRNFGAVQKVTN